MTGMDEAKKIAQILDSKKAEKEVTRTNHSSDH